MNKIVKTFAALAIFVLLTMPASAWKVEVPKNDPTDIQVSYKWYEAPLLAGGYAFNAADEVIKLANQRHMKVNRTKTSIAYEIQAHALAYEIGYHSSRANPVDILVSEGNSDWQKNFPWKQIKLK